MQATGALLPHRCPSHRLSLTARCSLQATPVKAGGTASAFVWSPDGGADTQWTVSC